MKPVQCFIFLILLILTGFSGPLFGQLQIGLGFIPVEKFVSATVLDLDSLVLYEDNLTGGGQLMPLVRYDMTINKNLQIGVGLEYYWTGLSLSTYKKSNDPLGPLHKGTVVGLPTFEIPLSMAVNTPILEIIHLQLTGSVMIVYNLVQTKSDHQVNSGAQPFPNDLAEILNAGVAIPKNSYLNYTYGLRMSFRRVSLEMFCQRNLSHTISRGVDLWGNHYQFDRRGTTTRFIVTYRITEK